MNKEQIEKLKKVIDDNLVIRGINVETKLTLNEKKRFELTSTNFQTFPVIHKNLRIEEFSNGIEKTEDKDIKRFYIDVSVRYDGNGVSLFSVEGRINKKNKEEIFIRYINHKY